MRTLRLLLLTTMLATLMPGCALFSRSTKATHVEDQNLGAQTLPTTPPPAPVQSSDIDSDTGEAINTPQKPIDIAPPPQRIQSELKVQTPPSSELPDGTEAPKAPNPKLSAGEDLFNRAVKQQNDAAFGEATKLWREYLNRFPGMPGFEQAHYNLAFCLFNLSSYKEAEEPLRTLLQGRQNAENSKLLINARILLAEVLLDQGNFDEALATSYEVIPDTEAERDAGVKRSASAVGQGRGQPDLPQKVRLYLLRGRVFASLRKIAQAQHALAQAKELLDAAEKSQTYQNDRRPLVSAWAWRSIEILNLACHQQNPVPERLSEAEFLAYADSYFGCAAPARQFYCTVLTYKDEQIRSQALAAYRALVESPIELRDHLPPPAREIRKEEQRSHYESEMKTLIEKTVTERSKEFKNLDSCGAYDVF